ncbi:MAG: hypothetical protein LBS98_05985 [Coriobacteriales bacterium]|nr:hypothetical protein [Coriobacteriales bacterium]
MSFSHTEDNLSAKRKSRLPVAVIVILAVVGVAVAATILFAVALPAIAGSLFLFGETFETRFLADYGLYEGHIEEEDALFEQNSQLLVFPEELSADMQVNDYYYACSTKGLDNSYQLLLDYQLPPEKFRQEVRRLEALSVNYNGQTKRVIYDTESFEYPAYVTVYTTHGDCEYALIDEENNRIIAVLAMHGHGSLDESLFPKTPIDYGSEADELGFSIYLFETKDGVWVTAGKM